MTTHELTYVEDDPKGYGDGLNDFYRCSCGATFQANGDIQVAFDHGVESVGPRRSLVYVSVSGGVADVMQQGNVDVVLIDWDNLREEYGLQDPNDTRDEINALIEEVSQLPQDSALRGVLDELRSTRKDLRRITDYASRRRIR